MKPRRLFGTQSPRTLGIAVMACALGLSGLGGSSARAQWGWGGGWGMGWGGGGSISNMATLNNINDRSASAANYAYSIRQNIPGTGNVYAGNPNSFVNNLRDTSFYQTFDVSSRRSTSAQAARAMPRRSGTSTSTPTTPPKPAVVPLGQFFSAAGVLVWPSESPVQGSLSDKRTTADQAVLSVFGQVKTQGFAPVGMVSDARTKLVEYGTPALDYLSQHAAPAAVDGFHQFLLSLYDSLGAAGTPKR
jgi:hypothetical protein